jgi:cytochrome c oxidase subunit 2
MDINALQSLEVLVDSVWTPAVASTQAADVDGLFYFIYWSCIVLTLMVVAPMVWFTFKYRVTGFSRKALSQRDHGVLIETLWSVLPFFYLIILFVWGLRGFLNLYIAPPDAMEMRVTGQKWFWTIEYPEDQVSVSGQGVEFVVPVDTNVKVILIAEDVLHSFFIPNFRVKMDVIPGRYTTLWFNSNREGLYPVLCTEYCGKDHSNMLAQIRVVGKEEFRKWIDKTQNESNSLPPVELGKKLYSSKGCNACHHVTDQRLVGPGFKGLYGKDEKLADGSTVKVDDAYMRESILNPGAKIVEGYPNVMTPYQGQLKEREIVGLIEYIKTLK